MLSGIHEKSSLSQRRTSDYSPNGSATKNQKTLLLYQDNYFDVSVKLNFCQRQTHCIDDKAKVQSVTDTENEFTQCQTPNSKLQSIGISPVSLHTLVKTLKSNVSDAYKEQVDCLKFQILIQMIKMK